MGHFVKKHVVSTQGLVLDSGTTAERPLNPMLGNIRFNLDTQGIEYFNGTVYVEFAKTGIARPFFSKFTGNGVTATFTMVYPVTNNGDILVFVGGVYQVPPTNYTVSGTSITFTSAPPNGVAITVIHGTNSTYVTSANVFDVPNL